VFVQHVSSKTRRFAEHSNPEELKQQAQQAGSEEQVKSLQERKKDFEEMMAQAKQLPTEAELMNLFLSVAGNTTDDITTRVHALQLLQELVEDIDLANGTDSGIRLSAGTHHANCTFP
jgi:Tfp pilus assembly protein PilO